MAAGNLTSTDGWRALDRWRRLAVSWYPIASRLERIWALRDNLSANDAGSVALVEVLCCPLLTADARLSRVPGVHCSVTVVPR